MVTNPGKRIHDIAEIFGQAYLKTAAPGFAVNGFKTCGSRPFDSEIFTEEDLAPSALTEDALDDTIVSTIRLPAVASASGTAVASGTSIQSEIKSLSPLPKITEKQKRKNISRCAKVLTTTPKNNDMKLQAQSRVKVRITQKTKTKLAKRVKIDGKVKKSEDETCVICGEPYSNSRAGEIRLKCAACGENWAHKLSALGNALFVCQFCDPE